VVAFVTFPTKTPMNTNTTADNAPLLLRAGEMRLALRPDLGGCIAGLWLGDVPVLRSGDPGALDSVRLSASYPLVPFSNRIGQARLEWQGTSHPLVRNFGGEEHSIHGLGWTRPWGVLENDTGFAMLSLEHRADNAWPFSFDASQVFRLSDSSLELTISMTNQSAQPAPAGLGWHPYFSKRARSRISFAASGRWEEGEDKLPTVRKAISGLDADCAFLDVDNCYDGWNGVAHLRDEALHVSLTSSLSRLVVYTNDTKDFVCIEPVSHVNNALNMLAQPGQTAEQLGVRILEPGESMSADMRIDVEKIR
jgi:aldose 1-epimerase